MTFTNRKELVMGGVICWPKPQAGIGGAVAEIGLVACEEPVLVGNIPIDSSHAEILGRVLRAYKIINADVGIAIEQSSVWSRVEGQHLGRSRVYHTPLRSGAVILDKVCGRHVIHRGGIEHLLQ